MESGHRKNRPAGDQNPPDPAIQNLPTTNPVVESRRETSCTLADREQGHVIDVRQLERLEDKAAVLLTGFKSSKNTRDH
jgi:hypothetical protein